MDSPKTLIDFMEIQDRGRLPEEVDPIVNTLFFRFKV